MFREKHQKDICFYCKFDLNGVKSVEDSCLFLTSPFLTSLNFWQIFWVWTPNREKESFPYWWKYTRENWYSSSGLMGKWRLRIFLNYNIDLVENRGWWKILTVWPLMKDNIFHHRKHKALENILKNYHLKFWV